MKKNKEKPREHKKHTYLFTKQVVDALKFEPKTYKELYAYFGFESKGQKVCLKNRLNQLQKFNLIGFMQETKKYYYKVVNIPKTPQPKSIFKNKHIESVILTPESD